MSNSTKIATMINGSRKIYLISPFVSIIYAQTFDIS